MPKFQLRNYQVDDLARAAMHDGCVLGWDPGLGKMLAGLIWPQLKGAERILLVAPEGLHQQMIDEAMEKLGITLQPLLSIEQFHADKTLQRAALQHRNGQPITERGWWITSYTALGYNGGDMWLPRAVDPITEEAVPNSTILKRRQAHPLYQGELDYGIGCRSYGEARPSDDYRRRNLATEDNSGKPLCLFYPSLAFLVSELFDCVECDEAVRLKSDDSFISLGVRELRPRYRLVLTGTPIKNRLDDIFWLCQWACGGHSEPTARWPYPNTNSARETFANEHMLSEQNHTREAEHVARTGRYKMIKTRTPQICNIHRLWKLLGPVVLRRRKDDTGEDMVPKTIVPIKVKPGTAQQTVYKFHLDHKPQIAKTGKPMNPIASAVAQLQNLRQAALCPDSANLSETGLSVFALRSIIAEEKAKAAKNPNADAKLTDKAALVARKGEATPFEGEAEAAFAIVERMAETGKIDIAKILEVAPSLEERLRPFYIAPTRQTTARSWTDHNPKQAAILKLIEELISKGEQVVVMSPFVHFSITLHRRLVEAGVSVCCLDGRLSPKKRGQIAKQFKRRKFAVLIGGIQSMGEGHSFECASHLILPSIEWAYDSNKQAIDRVHRLVSTKPVTIYTMVTANTIDERLESIFREKGDSSQLALDGRLFADKTDEINLGELLREAVRNFDPTAHTIDEKMIEEEWDSTLKQKLTIAERRFREWHPPIVADVNGDKVTAKEVRAAVRATEGVVTPVVALVKGIPSATFAALCNTTHATEIQVVRDRFTDYCSRHPQYKDWRIAWRNFEQSWGNFRKWLKRELGTDGFRSSASSEVAESQPTAALPAPEQPAKKAKMSSDDAKRFFDSL